MTRYSKDHMWIRNEGEAYHVGLTEYARKELGEIVYLEPPKPGAHVQQDETVCTIDSLKSTSDIYAPVSGSVIEVNPGLLEGSTKLINSDPFGAGWIFSMSVDDPEQLNQLLSDEDYERLIE